MLNGEIRYGDPRYDDYSRVAYLVEHCLGAPRPSTIDCDFMAEFIKRALTNADKAQYNFFNFVPVESAEGFEHLPQPVKDALEEINNRDRDKLELNRDRAARILQHACELYLILQKQRTGTIYMHQLKQFLK